MVADNPHTQAYQRWKEAPTPEALNSVVQTLEPSIRYALTSTQSANDPVVKAHARVLTAEAVLKFDPVSGASLPTWVTSQLQQLRRFKRQSQAVTAISESAQLDAFKLHNAELELQDQLGREPDLVELADKMQLPIKRITKIRKIMRKVPSEAALGELGAESVPDTEEEALGFIYHDSDNVDRSIIEMKTGFGGKYAPMAPKDIATTLRLTPTQLSRRSAKLAIKLQEIHAALNDIT